MSIFAITNNQVILGTGSVGANDTFDNGVLKDAATGTLNRATVGAGAQYSNGLLRNAAGQVKYVDATAGLPTPTFWANGLPVDSNGALCVSTNAAATFSNGIPFSSNGAVSASVSLS